MIDVKIGTTFYKSGRHNVGRVYTVTDELTTTNSAGKIVDVSFECEHIYLKHKCKTYETIDTIKKGLIEEG